MPAPNPVAEAARAAVRALTAMQERDGHWQDYALPVGASDAWVTAYAGFALAEAGAPDESARAAGWLLAHRYPEGGWGFNGITGPDADSTAWAVRLLDTLGQPVDREDLALLLSFRRPDGGFATYHEPDWWGRSQPDVTAAVLLALPVAEQAAVLADALRYLEKIRLVDGSWPAYWWRTGHYATALCIELLERAGRLDDHALPVVTEDESHAIHSAFDLACVALGLSAATGDPSVTGQLMRELIATQGADGGWPGGANLRITDPVCAAPWLAPRGRRYTDERAVITIATALRALTRARAAMADSLAPGVLLMEGAGR